MKLGKTPIKPLIAFTAVLVFLSGNAYSFERYDYNRIKDEYKSYYCPLPQTGSSKDKAIPCVLDRKLTLKQALELALTNNPDAQIAEARVAQSRAMLQKSNAAFMPMLNVYTEYTRADAPSAFLFKSIDERQLATNNFNDPGIISNFESGISAQVSLFNGGRNILGREMAKEDLAMNTTDKLAAENTISAQLISAWYDTLSALEFVKIAEESVTTVKNQLDVMTVRFKGGSALKSDILSLNVRLAQAQEDLLRSKNRYKLATTGLATILGVNTDKDIDIDNTPFSITNVPMTYEEGMNTAMSKRPELTKIRSMVKKSRMGMDMAKSAYLPMATLMGKYYLDDPNMDYSRGRENWVVGVMLNWNIFSGFSDKSGVAASDAMLNEALSADRKALLNISFDVKSAYLRYEEAKARIDVAKRSVLMSEESLDLVRKQYEGGSVNITRYLEAELDRNMTKIRATSAYYDREKSLADIARATGLLSQPSALITTDIKEKNDAK